jgi:hypothetical protein
MINSPDHAAHLVRSSAESLGNVASALASFVGSLG